MNTQVLKLVVILTTVLLMLSLAGAARAQGETSGLPAVRSVDQLTCTDWNLASDFRRWPNQENPNRDSCGNLGVWHFMESNGLNRNPATYTLLPYYANSDFGIVGLEKWTGSGYFRPPPDGLPGFLLNTTGVPQYVGGALTYPPDVAVAHPENSRLAVAGWRSPVSGSVAITGSVKDLNAYDGDGILWFIGRGNAELASGSIPNGDARTSPTASAPRTLSRFMSTRGTSSTSPSTPMAMRIAIRPNWTSPSTCLVAARVIRCRAR